MISSKNDMILFMKADKIALARERKRPRVDDLVWRFEISLRKCEYYKNCRRHSVIGYLVYLFYWLQYERLSVKCGFSIPLNCFDMGLSISHRGSIIVNSGAKIGKNCRIHVGVNIGTQAGYDHVAPKIGDNVYIGPGAKIFGDITIADNVVIGANAVVNKNFLSPNVSIAGIPAKVISNKGRFNLGPLENTKFKKMCDLCEKFRQ